MSAAKEEVIPNREVVSNTKQKRKPTIVKRNVEVDEPMEPQPSTSTGGTTEPKPKTQEAPKQKEESGEEDKKDNRNHICTNCNLCYDHMSLSQLKKKLKEELETKMKILCSICVEQGAPKRPYGTEEKLKRHIAIYHPTDTGVVFECKQCAERFQTKTKLRNHLGKTHPGFVQFSCEVCAESFKLKTNYKTHLKTHNIVPNETLKHVCEVCKGTFVSKSGLEAHRKRFPGPHTKLKCTKCKYRFSNEMRLKNHRCMKMLLEEAEKKTNEVVNMEKLPGRELFQAQPESTISIVNVESGDVVRQHYEQQSAPQKPKRAAPKADKQELLKFESSKEVLLHDDGTQIYYRPYQLQTDGIHESVYLQRGEIISTDSDQTIIIARDIENIPGQQLYQVDVNELENGEDVEQQVFHINIGDWNMVPFTLKDKT